MVVGPSVSLSPITEIALPPIVTGRDRSGSSCVPPSSPPSPSVVAEPPPVPGCTTVSAPDDSLSPITEIALPPTVTGRLPPMIDCVPPRMLSSPLVSAVEPSPAAVDESTAVEASDDSLSPITEIAFPPTVTGRSTPPITWVPPRIESSPDVLAAPPSAVPESPGATGAVACAPSLDESPMTQIGVAADRHRNREVDERLRARAHSVVTRGDGGGVGRSLAAGVETSVAASDDDESPMIEMPLPLTVTGSSIEIAACVPERMPSSPPVSDACATPAPRSVSPPAKRVAYSALNANFFMIQYS